MIPDLGLRIGIARAESPQIFSGVKILQSTGSTIYTKMLHANSRSSCLAFREAFRCLPPSLPPSLPLSLSHMHTHTHAHTRMQPPKGLNKMLIITAKQKK